MRRCFRWPRCSQWTLHWGLRIALNFFHLSYAITPPSSVDGWLELKDRSSIIIVQQRSTVLRLRSISLVSTPVQLIAVIEASCYFCSSVLQGQECTPQILSRDIEATRVCMVVLQCWNQMAEDQTPGQAISMCLRSTFNFRRTSMNIAAQV